MNIDEASILISGGGGGLGSSFALDLASRGARILVGDINKEALAAIEEDAKQKKLSIDTFQADISKEKDVEDLFRTFVKRFVRVDVMINNAAVAEDGLLVKKTGSVIEKFPFSRWQRGLAVNLTGVFFCGREAAFYMIQQDSGGLILNMSSISRHGNFIQSNYSATKAAIAALTVVWAKELSKYGIRSVALAPGYIDSPLTRNIPEGVRKRIVSTQIPLGRMAEINEITHAIRFIIENDYINGRVLDIDGGLRL